MNLFTYGTLMFPEVWRIVVGREFTHSPAELPGYQIFCVREAVYPGIIEACPSLSTFNSHPAIVSGQVYCDLDAASIARLDRFEGDQYRRQSVTVICPDGRRLDAQAYVVPSELSGILTDEHWTAGEFEARGHLANFMARYGGFNRLD